MGDEPLFVILPWFGGAVIVWWAVLFLDRMLATRRYRRPYPPEPGAWAHVPRKDWPRRKRRPKRTTVRDDGPGT